jgi:predicted restriction endonuclease
MSSSKIEIDIPKKFLDDFKINESDLKTLEDFEDIQSAQNLLEKVMTANISKHSKIRIGLPNKFKTEQERYPFESFEAYWIESYGIWWASEKKENSPNPKYRNLFGVNEPKWEETKKQYRNHQVCEINHSFSGSSKIIGAYVSDNDGNIYLATERIGGLSGRGKYINEIESIFSKKSQLYSIKYSEGKRNLFIISKLNSDKALSQINFFIQNIQNLKNQFEIILVKNSFEDLKDVIDKKMSQEDDVLSTHTNDNETLIDFSDKGSDSLVHSRGTTQDIFKELLMQEYDKKCVFCGFDEPKYLIGSHIVPHSEMLEEDPKNVGNPTDGLLLCRLCDYAFEIGNIRLEENLDITITQKLKDSKNPSVFAWLSNINKKITIKSDAKYAPSLKYIQKKLKSQINNQVEL